MQAVDSTFLPFPGAGQLETYLIVGRRETEPRTDIYLCIYLYYHNANCVCRDPTTNESVKIVEFCGWRTTEHVVVLVLRYYATLFGIHITSVSCKFCMVGFRRVIV